MAKKLIDKYADKLTPSARYRARHIDASLCIYCSRPRCEKSKTLCTKHLDEARVYQARVRDCFKKYNLMVSIHKTDVNILHKEA